MHTHSDPMAWLPLKPEVFAVLVALVDGERHGYAIIKEVERSTDGQIRLAPSPLYRRLKRLLDTGIIAETEERPAPELDDKRRRYYRLTALGRRVVGAEARRLVSLADGEKIRRMAKQAGPKPSHA